MGSRLAQDLSKDYEVVVTIHEEPCPVKGVETEKVDFTDFDSFEDLIERTGAEVLIHAAAWSNMEQCQKKEDDAYAVNADATESLLEQMTEADGYAIVISTDQVFDGKKGPFQDESPTRPISVYGQTKAEAEGLVDPDRHLAIRLPLLYGKGLSKKKSFFETMIADLQAGQTVDCFKDQMRTPLALFQATRAIGLLLPREPKGLMNIAGTESISRYNFAIRVAEMAKLPTDLINPVSQSHHSMGKWMPADVSMKNRLVFAHVDRNLLLLEDGLQGSLREMGLI